MDLQCEDVDSGGVITPMENKCYNLVFDSSSDQTVFTVDASQTNGIAFFAEHLPTEFEATEHYFKDTTGVDIEPVAQELVPGADSPSHGHGADAFEGKCVCKAKEKGCKL